jgi:hypothetical protein
MGRLLPLLLVVLLWSDARAGEPRRFIALSLREAERLVVAGGDVSRVSTLAGITDVIGFALDPRRDVILVGIAEPNRAALSLDSLVAAMRAVIRYKQQPLVSIDPPADPLRPDMQPVRFEGNLEDSQLGFDLLQADIALKKLALGQWRADVWGVKSYLALSLDHVRTHQQVPPVRSRFWIRAGDVPVSGGERQGALIVHNVQLIVETGVLGNSETADDPVGRQFAEHVVDAFPDLVLQSPVLGKVPPILRMVTLVQGLARTSAATQLAYWLDRYQPGRVRTDRQLRLETVSQQSTMGTLELSGGIALSPTLVRLNAGDAGVLRDIVTSARPRPDALSWDLPLPGWDYSGGHDYLLAGGDRQSGAGFSLRRHLASGPVPPASSPRTNTPSTAIPRMPTPVLPQNRQPLPDRISPLSALRPILPTFQAFRSSSRVGGVMLQGTATLIGDGSAVDIAADNFALVMEGERARPSELAFRKFVTALWAVYYHKQDPGISIDPIAQGVPQHLVRYIGNVLYTDLGRVMREADYLMKKWAVGTERPDYPGFKSVEERWAQDRGALTNASRRFWFVPEHVQFKKAGNLLLFESGQMTLRTEVASPELRRLVLASDRTFAAFFTEHYDRIAARYPVFAELMEYAKLVSLAKYLKESGVPLYWFLMANKDLVIGEDSPGVVDELVKESASRRGITIRGGVNLGFEGRYRLDQAALNALRQASARSSGPRTRSGAPDQTAATQEEPVQISRQPVSFKVDDSSYSVAPQHASASGKDRHGIRYQTDMAIRKDGGPGLELARYFDSNHRDDGDFGNGWRLLVPYRIRPASDERRVFLNASIPTQMLLENVLTGGTDLLTFNESRYSVSGYLPESAAARQVIGLFITAGGFFRLADRIGNEFWFDQAGHLTDMLLGDDVRVQVAYQRGAIDGLETVPYRIERADTETVPFRNAVLPKRVVIHDRIHGTAETLMFSADGRIAGYVPLEPATSRYRFLAIMSDASYRLADSQGNETTFDGSGAFKQMFVADGRALVKSLAVGDQQITMRYTIGPTGRIVIAAAHLAKNGSSTAPASVVRYSYNADGTLASVVQGGAANLAAAR